MQTWADLPFANGVYRFALDMGGILAIEDRLNTGIGGIQARTLAGRWSPQADQFDPTQTEYRFRECVEVVRESLIRGAFAIVDGVEQRVTVERANTLIRDYVDHVSPQQMPINDVWALAWAIISGRIIGFTDETEKKSPNPGN